MRDDDAVIDERLERIGAFPFRAKFHLRGQELAYLSSRGMQLVAEHARDFVRQRLSVAQPAKDGAQTPWGGHPVFRAQHATATCCRGCLAKNHAMPRGRELTDEQQAYIVAVIMRWIEREAAAARARGPQLDTSQHIARRGAVTSRSRAASEQPPCDRLF